MCVCHQSCCDFHEDSLPSVCGLVAAVFTLESRVSTRTTDGQLGVFEPHELVAIFMICVLVGGNVEDPKLSLDSQKSP